MTLEDAASSHLMIALIGEATAHCHSRTQLKDPNFHYYWVLFSFILFTFHCNPLSFSEAYK